MFSQYLAYSQWCSFQLFNKYGISITYQLIGEALGRQNGSGIRSICCHVKTWVPHSHGLRRKQTPPRCPQTSGVVSCRHASQRNTLQSLNVFLKGIAMMKICVWEPNAITSKLGDLGQVAWAFHLYHQWPQLYFSIYLRRLFWYQMGLKKWLLNDGYPYYFHDPSKSTEGQAESRGPGG